MTCAIEIEVSGHPGLGGRFELGADRPITAGRSGGCDIVLDDPLIAPRHFRIVLRSDGPWIENLDPEIGVYLGDEFVEESCRLGSGVEIDLGEVQLVARFAWGEAETPVPPAEVAPDDMPATISPEPSPAPAPEPEPAPVPAPVPEPAVATSPPPPPSPPPPSPPPPSPPPPSPVPPTPAVPDQPAAANDKAEGAEPTRPSRPPPQASGELPGAPPTMPASAPDEPTRPTPPSTPPNTTPAEPARPAPTSANSPASPPPPVREPEPRAIPTPVQEPPAVPVQPPPPPPPPPPPAPPPRPVRPAEPPRGSPRSLPRAVRELVEPIIDAHGEGIIENADDEALLRYAERATDLADEFGLPSGEARPLLFRCMVLLGSDLSQHTGLATDIVSTISMADRDASTRLKRVRKIADRIADRPAGSTPGVFGTPSPVRPSEPTPAFTPRPEPVPPAPAAPVPPPAPAQPLPPAEPRLTNPPSPPPSPPPQPPAQPPAPRLSGADEPPGESAIDASFTGYTLEHQTRPGEYEGRDTTTGDRIRLALVEGPPASAHERMLRVMPVTHRALEVIENTGVGQAGGGERAFVAVRDLSPVTLGQILARSSPRPLPSLDADEVAGVLGLRRETVAGEVERALDAGDRPYERLVMLWLSEIAEGVHRAHEHGLVHGAISPSSVVLDPQGMVRLRWLGRYDPDLLTVGEIDAAVCPLLSPERVAAVASGVPMSAALRPTSDLWGLGVFTIAMLTGSLPFAGRGAGVFTDIVTKTVPDPRGTHGDVSQDAAELCLGLLERDPSKRPPFASAVSAAARGIAEGKGSGGKKVLGLFGRKG